MDGSNKKYDECIIFAYEWSALCKVFNQTILAASFVDLHDHYYCIIIVIIL